MNATLNPTKKVLHISKNHNALVFIKLLYEVEDIVLSPAEPGYVSFCVTYLVVGDEDQTIVTNYDDDNPNLPFREISASSKEIRIRGAKTKSLYVPIEHEAKETEWTTVFVEWSKPEGSFHVNGKYIVGTFTCQETLDVEETQISIGGRIGGSRLFNGAISALEMYVDAESRLPDALKNLIISRQMIRNGNEGPQMKKKKV